MIPALEHVDKMLNAKLLITILYAVVIKATQEIHSVDASHNEMNQKLLKILVYHRHVDPTQFVVLLVIIQLVHVWKV